MKNDKRIFEDHEDLVSPYYESIRIAQESGDITKAEEMERTRQENIKMMSKESYYRPEREKKMIADHFITGFVPEVAVARLFSKKDVLLRYNIDEFKWNCMAPGEFVEKGDFEITANGKKYRMDLKSRKLWGKIDSGWVEINEWQTRKGDNGNIDGYMFAALDRRNGIIYLLGYMMHSRFVELRNQAIKFHQTGDSTYNNGVQFVRKGDTMPSGKVCIASYWKIPYCHISKFACAYRYGNFEQAVQIAEEVADIYPISTTKNESKNY